MLFYSGEKVSLVGVLVCLCARERDIQTVGYMVIYLLFA